MSLEDKKPLPSGETSLLCQVTSPPNFTSAKQTPQKREFISTFKFTVSNATKIYHSR